MSNIEKQLAGLSPAKRDLLEKYLQSKTTNVLEYINHTRMDSSSRIEKASVKEFYPASSAQKRMYIINRMEEVGTSYNMLGAVTVEGRLDIYRLEETFRTLIQRHEAFRTSFEMIDGEPVQRVHPMVTFGISRWEAEEDGITEIIKDFVKPFDLDKAPLLRVGLIVLSKTRNIVLYDMHHIISDGASMAILIKEFTTVYNGGTLPELRIQYKDFSEWQHKLFQSEAIQKQKVYCLNTFAGEIPVLELPTDYPRPPAMSFEGGMVDVEVNAETTAKLKQYSFQKSATLFMTLLASYNVLLAHMTGQEDIITGAPVAGRGHADLQNIIGMFVNTVALRNYPRFEITFEAFLEAVRQNTLAAFANQDYQFEMLLEDLKLKRDLSRNPLFDTVFNFQNVTATDGDREPTGDVRFMPYEYETANTKFDITMYVSEREDTIRIHCNYRTGLFKRTTIEYIMNEYLRLLQAIAENPRLKTKEYPIFLRSNLPVTLQQVIPQVEYEPFPGEAVRQSIGKYFETLAGKNGSQVAVRTDQKTWTYGELNAKANRIAWTLIHQQGAGQTVALLFEHGAEMIAAMLGALKAGSIYVPFDPDYPAERLAYMLEDSKAQRIITNNANLSVAETLNRSNQGINIINADKLEAPETNPDIKIAPETPAYIIYTSGSTGHPKGVVQTHQNILKLVGEFVNQLHINSRDRLALFTSYSHTVAVIDIFSALFCGAAVYPLNVKYSGDMAQMVCWIKEERITIYHSVPTVYRYCMEMLAKEEILPTIRLVILGGEAVSQHDAAMYRQHFTSECIFVNLLGSSELLVATSYLVDKETEIDGPLVPAGYFFKDVDAYILDEKGTEAPIFGTGEIVYKSEYLAQGYWNQPEKTGEVFVTDPVTGEGLVYHSGDLGRFLPDGSLEYLGRMDSQVKIRGYRIEPGEIEAHLLKHEAIKETAVITKEDKMGNKHLCAYFSGDRELNVQDLRIYLAKTLPEYMIPSYFVQLDRLPLTPNGKIDRKALPEPEGPIPTGVDYVAPETDLEIMISDIWKEILNLDKIGVNDQFFNIGGNSISLLKLNTLLNQKLNKQIATVTLFQYPTIRSFAQYLTQQEATEDHRREILENADESIQLIEQFLNIE